MPRALPLTLACLALMTVVAPPPARAQSAGDPYSIIRPEPGERKTETQPSKPEPWLAPKYQSPRGTRERVGVPRPEEPKAAMPKMPRAPKVPPPIVVPETGRALPNLPTISPSGPRGTESFQDRAARCAHQAGVYGEAAGNRSAYIGSCVNQ
jgi:hypothetical protein